MRKTILTLFAVILLIPGVINSKDYKGAEFRTKQSFLYGRFEVSMKSAAREGMLSSFFTYNDNMSSIDQWNEIDIEIMGRYDNDLQFNTITANQTSHVGRFPTPFSPHADFHTYAIEWTPAYVAWFVDGTEVYRQTGAHISTINKAQKLMMNIWNPTYANWAGVFDPNALPAFAYYDWVKYYTYTPGNGNYGTGNNFSLSWSDDFDYCNTARWEKGTHTFDGNGCDFVTTNAVITGGKLILCLTDATNLGYTDVKGPVFYSARVVNGKVIAYFSEELDSVTSQNAGNFNIVGATTISAKIRSDRKSVELTVDNWDFTSARNLIVLNVKDAWGNTMSPRALAIYLERTYSWPYKINCGGGAVIGYLADGEFGWGAEHGFLDGQSSAYAANLQINGTTEPEIYRAEKYGMATYRVRVPAGTYKVKLMFAENYYTQAGKRIFDVFVEAVKRISQLDIYAQVGGSTALVKEITGVAVNDGVLDIHFVSHLDYPLINGIVIEPEGTSVGDAGTENPGSFILNQNYPNPFNGQTTVSFFVNKPGNYSYTLTGITGETIARRDLGWLEEGNYTLPITSRDLTASGVYLFTLAGNSIFETRKLVLLN